MEKQQRLDKSNNFSKVIPEQTVPALSLENFEHQQILLIEVPIDVDPKTLHNLQIVPSFDIPQEINIQTEEDKETGFTFQIEQKDEESQKCFNQQTLLLYPIEGKQRFGYQDLRTTKRQIKCLKVYKKADQRSILKSAIVKTKVVFNNNSTTTLRISPSSNIKKQKNK